MNFLDCLQQQIYQYMNRNRGEKPSLIILVSRDIVYEFERDCLKQLRERDNRIELTQKSYEFLGIPVHTKGIITYGGDCKWMLVGD